MDNDGGDDEENKGFPDELSSNYQVKFCDQKRLACFFCS